MSRPSNGNLLKSYQQVDVHGGVTEASPYRLVQMLLDGALDRIAAAKGHLQRGDNGEKGQQIGRAIAILGGLRNGLDRSAGSELADNLDALYEYMEHRLLEANMRNDAGMLDEVGRLLSQIRSGWAGIGDKAPQAGPDAPTAPRNISVMG